MRLAIIDVGSNTIRAVVYQHGAKVQNESVFAGLVQYVENGTLSSLGVEAILKAFSVLLPRILPCDRMICFATASLRGLSNSDAVIDTVREKTGVLIRLLTAAEEARYDYLGLCRTHRLSEGIGGDLGGGSMQLYTFDTRGLLDYCSLPLGSMRLRCDFVKDAFPTEAEGAAIEAYVKTMLSEKPQFQNLPFEDIYLTGGSIRAICKLWGDDGKIDKNAISAAIKTYSPKTLSAACSDRAETILPALYTLKALLDYTNATRLLSVESGVREGILSALSDEDFVL